MRRLLSITKLCLDLVFCLQCLLSSNKWPRPRYVRNYSSHIKVVRSLEKNIYYENIGNVSSTPASDSLSILIKSSSLRGFTEIIQKQVNWLNQ